VIEDAYARHGYELSPKLSVGSAEAIKRMLRLSHAVAWVSRQTVARAISPHSPFGGMPYRYGSYRNNIFYFCLPGEYDVDMEAPNKVCTCNPRLAQICATNAADERRAGSSCWE
jgi:hypothetical protein